MNKTWKKCIFIFFIIFIIVLAGGTLSINYLHDTIINNNVYQVTAVVSDKYYDTNVNDYYLVKTNDNQTFSIVDNGDGRGEQMWQDIIVGKKYKLIVKKPELIDVDNFSHIIQVHNATR